MALNDNIDVIKNNTNDYLKSREDLEEKKYLLEEAQFISDKYKLGYIIFSESYADKNKKKYLKAHFNIMIGELDKRMYSGFFDIDIINRLSKARQELNATKKYEII